MNQILNHNHCWLPKPDLCVSSTILMLFTMPYSPSLLLQGGCITTPSLKVISEAARNFGLILGPRV